MTMKVEVATTVIIIIGKAVHNIQNRDLSVLLVNVLYLIQDCSASSISSGLGWTSKYRVLVTKARQIL